MTTRVLPPEEWPKLEGTYVGPALPLLPASSRVVVVENDQGEILACWAALPIWHTEGIWVREDCRGRGRTLYRLKEAMLALLRSLGAEAAWTAADSPDVAALIQSHLSAVKVPTCDHFIFSVR